MSLFDNFEFPIKCPTCGHEEIKNLSWIKTNKSFSCPVCNCTIEIEADEMIDGYESLEKVIKN